MGDLSHLHTLHGALLQKRVRIALAGVGGNGSQVLNGLARLDLAMRALGHDYGLHVTAFDEDEVSEANVGRNLWSPSDIGANKAVLAVTRLNAFYGLDFDAEARPFDDALDGQSSRCDILISCVDTRSARAVMREMIDSHDAAAHYWLDLGNLESLGQVVLGEVITGRRSNVGGSSDSLRLPYVTDLFPEVADTTIPDVNRHSCSLAIGLESQGLFVNDFTSRIALQILYRLLTRGQIEHHGALVNLDTLRMSPIPVSAAAWRRFGYNAEAAAMQVTEELAA